MKRRFAVILCLALIMVSVVGCGGNTSQKTEVEKQAEITPSTSAAKEEKTPAKDAEVTVAATEAAKEETTPKVTEEAKEEKTPTATEEPKEDKTQTATEETTTSAPVEETTTPEPVYVIDKYTADNEFSEFVEYGSEMGAADVILTNKEWNIDFDYGSYYVTIGTNQQDAEYCYIGIGGLDDSDLTYACLVRYTDVPTLPLTSNGTFFPTSAAHMLEDTINYMKNHPDPNTKPDIPGMNFESWAVLIGG